MCKNANDYCADRDWTFVPFTAFTCLINGHYYICFAIICFYYKLVFIFPVWVFRHYLFLLTLFSYFWVYNLLETNVLLLLLLLLLSSQIIFRMLKKANAFWMILKH
jgi:hypothetical protein